MDSECTARMPSSEPPLTSGCSTETGLGLPGALQVALVGDQQGAALAAPVDDLAQVVGRQHPAGRVGRRVDPDQRRVARAERGQRVGGDDLGADQRRTDLVGRVGQLRAGRRGRPGPRPRWVGSPAISSLEPIDGSTPSRPRPVTPKRRREPVDAGLPGLRQADGGRVARASRRRRAAPAARPRGVGSTGVPTERSTMPSGWARACSAYGVSWSQGKSGSRAETRPCERRPRQAHSWFCGGSAAIIGWSLSISPILAAPPGEPRSSKKCTLAS